MGRGREQTKKTTTNDIKGGRAVKNICVTSFTQILLCTFFCNSIFILLGFSESSDNITVSNKKNTSKKDSASKSERTT